MVVVQCVENGFALPPEAHKLGVLEHPQLVADGRLAQLHGVRDILHAKFAVVQGVQNFDAGGIAEHAEQVCQFVQHLIVRHLHRLFFLFRRGLF